MVDSSDEGQSEQDSSHRVWASRWYRITPRSFVHEELLFSSDTIFRVFAGQSYKSLLLRRDGRAEYAHEIGEEFQSLSSEQLSDHEDTESIPVSSVISIELTSGTFLRKPKLTIKMDEHSHTYYHPEKSYDVDDLGQQLVDQYPAHTITVDGSAP